MYSVRNSSYLPLFIPDTRKAGLTDELTASIHYGEVSQMITKVHKRAYLQTPGGTCRKSLPDASA